MRAQPFTARIKISGSDSRISPGCSTLRFSHPDPAHTEVRLGKRVRFRVQGSANT